MSSTVSPLWTPLRIGSVTVPHRLVYAPLTRCRADGEGKQPPSAATYYAQRAAAGGLIISEATNVAPEGQGYPCTPGLWSAAQVDAWRPIAAAVKKAHPGAAFFAQLWHTGRVAHPSYAGPDATAPLAPSSIVCPPEHGTVTTATFESVPYMVPRAMAPADCAATLDAYVAAARNAVEAGFDGVEVHAANGYLLEQFLRASTNKRDDEYGPAGPSGRATYVLQVVDAVAAAIGADRVGVRISPWGRFLIDAPDPAVDHPTYDALVAGLASMHGGSIAYLHAIEPRMTLGNEESALAPVGASLDRWRALWRGGDRVFVAAGGFTRARALAHADAHPDGEAVCVGRWWLANPDLVARWAAPGPDGAPLNPYDRDTFYVGGDAGFVDYPVLDDVPAGTPTARAKDGSLVFEAAKK